MVGSSTNIACPNFIINSIVASELSYFADVLENATDFEKTLDELLRDTVKKHKRIIFSGNNYSKAWEEEAEKRGLLNLKTTVDALPLYASDKNVEMFEKLKVLSKSEILSRTEILLENYSNIVHIEAITALDMARKEIVPAIIKYQSFLLKELKEKKKLSSSFDSRLEESLIDKISRLSGDLYLAIDALNDDLKGYDLTKSNYDKAVYCRDVLLKDMNEVRAFADEIELIIGKEFYPFPSYEDILYSVKD
jgi:glutamine synthetase